MVELRQSFQTMEARSTQWRQRIGRDRGKTVFEKEVKFFSTIDDFMYWYNCVRPHAVFDISKLETPIKVFYQRMPQKKILVGPSLLAGEEMIL